MSKDDRTIKKLFLSRKFAIVLAVVVIVAATVFGVLKPASSPDATKPPAPVETPPPAQATTPPPADQDISFLVADNAGVLSNSTQSYIISENLVLMQQSRGAQVAVVTAEIFAGTDEEANNHAQGLFISMGVANNGMLLFLTAEDGNEGVWLVTGAGISNSFNNSLVNQYLDRFFGYEYPGTIDAAVKGICEALFAWYAGSYNTTQSVPQSDQTGQTDQNYGNDHVPDYTTVIVFLVIFILFTLMIVMMTASSDRRRHRMYYTHMGMPIPRYRWWFMWGPRPYRTWYRSHYHFNQWRGPQGPRGPGGFGGGGRSGGGFGGGGGRSGGGGGRR